MDKITPIQFISQWLGADHRLRVNTHNFEVKLAKAAVDVFQDSFESKKFDRKSWPHWQGKYVGKGSLMDETGTLKNSIRIKNIEKNQIEIFTDPSKFHSAARHQGFCYAGVHNNLNELSHRPSRGPKVQRQFIGHSYEIKQKIKKLSLEIFKGFPQ